MIKLPDYDDFEINQRYQVNKIAWKYFNDYSFWTYRFKGIWLLFINQIRKKNKNIFKDSYNIDADDGYIPEELKYMIISIHWIYQDLIRECGIEPYSTDDW
jgi:hypothetical protein